MTELATSPKLQLLPAIDMVDGKAVRLTQGAAGTETNYGSPVDAAMDWIEQGAEWIHLVDLDAAFGRGSNVGIARKIIARAGSRVKIEFSGGIRDDKSLEAALEMGAARVNLGTAALENPEWTRAVIAHYGEQIAVGVPGAAPVPDGAGPGPANGAGPAPALVNLNSAGVAELDALPGIGPVIAQRIVDFRQESGPFTSVDQLAEVSGIGPSILAKIKDQVTV